MVSIAGKTGTAQVVALKPDGDKDKNKELQKEFRDHAWFVAFAPVEHPKIAVVVLVEHMGHGGSASAPLAKTLIEAYMSFQTTPQEPSL
jgi:penicillin-binding protein 2